MLFANLFENLRKLITGNHCGGTPDAESAAFRACQPSNLIECSVVFSQNVSSPPQQMFASLSQNHVTRRSNEHFCANFRFKLANLHANRGLGNVNSLGSGGEGSRFSDGDEGS